MMRLTSEVANRHQHAAFINRMHMEVQASVVSERFVGMQHLILRWLLRPVLTISVFHALE